MRYLIGTGWFHRPSTSKPDQVKQAQRWLSNVIGNATPPPERIAIICQGGCRFGIEASDFTPLPVEIVHVSGDLGNHNDLIQKRKPHAFSGWFGSVFALAMLAYNNESDLIYQEQDCLAFGDYVGQLYKDIGNAGVLFGRAHRGHPNQCCSQSLMLIKHSYIPEFCSLLLSSHPMTTNEHTGEPKFMVMKNLDPANWKQFEWGYDRERPFNLSDKVFYVQQLKPDELAELSFNGLIDPRYI